MKWIQDTLSKIVDSGQAQEPELTKVQLGLCHNIVYQEVPTIEMLHVLISAEQIISTFLVLILPSLSHFG